MEYRVIPQLEKCVEVLKARVWHEWQKLPPSKNMYPYKTSDIKLDNELTKWSNFGQSIHGYDTSSYEGRTINSFICEMILESNAFHDIDRKIMSASSVLDLFWTSLNTGIYSEVPQRVKTGFTWCSICLCFYMICKLQYDIQSKVLKMLHSCVMDYLKSVMYVVDKALIMGRPIKRNPLVKVGYYVNQLLMENFKPTKTIKSSWDQLCRLEPNKISNILDCAHSISFVKRPSVEVFVIQYLKESKPVVLMDIVDHWPAMKKWSLYYFKKVAGARYVPIEIGSKYTDESWTQAIMPVSLFIDEYVSGEKLKDVTVYLAQYEIFTQIPELKQDFYTPDYCLTTEFSAQLNIWLGPGGTISPLHYDDKENILVQIFGYKYLRIYDKCYSSQLYPTQNKLLSNTSEIDLDDKLAFEKWPHFKDLPYKECILSPGQSIFIPKGFWHYVKALTASCSISFWWPSSNE